MINELMEIILKERKAKHIEDDMGIQKCWEKMTNILSEDEDETIAYLNKCPKEDLYYISEVFEDISENLQSIKFIACLRELDKKFPELDMTNDINLAEEYL